MLKAEFLRARIISIHAPPRGATTIHATSQLHPRFQFTPLREGRPDEKCGNRTEEVFQFTPLREGRLELQVFKCACPKFQFTPLREGRRNCRRLVHFVLISIHAPPRGATAARKAAAAKAVEFQFTPLREGRLLRADLLRNRDLFQFTPLREGRQPHPCLLRTSRRFQFTPLREGRRCSERFQPIR